MSFAGWSSKNKTFSRFLSTSHETASKNDASVSVYALTLLFERSVAGRGSSPVLAMASSKPLSDILLHINSVSSISLLKH